MNQNAFMRPLLLLMTMLFIPLGVWADREVTQPQFGKQVITVASDEVITFKDPKGDTDYSGTTSENAQSLTVFQPAESGMSIQITFESMNMGGSGSYYSFATFIVVILMPMTRLPGQHRRARSHRVIRKVTCQVATSFAPIPMRKERPIPTRLMCHHRQMACSP